MSNIGLTPTHIDITTARQMFFEQGKYPDGWVPEVIARSWQRCTQFIDNAEQPPPNRIDSHVLNECRELRGRLRNIVEPEMESLAELVADSNSLVLLADAEGMILDAAGGLEFLSKAQRLALQPGVDWSESGRGTNAIGTALVERQPVIVNGGQHYLENNNLISCAAAPIFSPQGEILGVLDVSGDCDHVHIQALGMVRLAIQMVEHRLIRDCNSKARQLRFHRRSDLLGSHREAILMLDDTHIVGANRAALQLLNTDWKKLLNTSVEHWLQLPRTSGEAMNINSPVNGECYSGIVDGSRSIQVPVPAGFTCDQGSGNYVDDDMRRLLEQARKVLDAGVSVLVTGETGVGKEVFARQLHECSQRSQQKFIAVNCAALPESLIESELFGYECGAFTGARRTGMPGRIREADGGILFLDEIGDMPLAMQARLLRVLQEREVQPLGGGKSVEVDFALICSTHCDLAEMVANGTFRADLYYRIQDFTLHLPPLRERQNRRDLISMLFTQLGGDARQLSLSEDVLQSLCDYDWPGNLRQLSSSLRTLVALCEHGGTINIDQLPQSIRQHAPTNNIDDEADSSLQNQTHKAIEEALVACNGSVSAAARQLGIHRSTIYRWLAK